MAERICQQCFGEFAGHPAYGSERFCSDACEKQNDLELTPATEGTESQLSVPLVASPSSAIALEVLYRPLIEACERRR